jgi:RHS repeat-associated protein
MRRIDISAIRVLCFVVVPPLTLSGQNLGGPNYLYGTGSQTWGINIPIENGFINVANGEVHLEISLATLPQRGTLPLNERLVYDSRIWQITQSGSSYNFVPTNVPVPYSGANPQCTGNPPAACNGAPGTVTLTNLTVPNSMAGWRFVAGTETGIIQGYLSGTLTDPQQSSYWNWGWTDPSGTTHYFNATTGTVWCPSCGPSSATSYAMDGSGFYLSVTNYTNATVFDADGNEVYPALIDRNGNTFTTNASGNLVDTLGRVPVAVSSSGNNIYYDVLTIGGATARYTITTETLNVHTNFLQSSTNDYSGTLTAIQSMTLPDGSQYSFTYDSGTTAGNYGEMESMTLPTGGTVSFSYENYLDSYQNENRWLTTYGGGYGNYVFAPQVITQCSGPNDTGCIEQMTVQDGNTNQAVYLLTLNNGAWNTQVDIYKGNVNPVHVLSRATTYNFANSAPSWFGTGSMWATASNTTTTLSDTGQEAETVYSYTQPWFGKPTKVQMWDYSASKSGTATKETDYTYGYLVNGAAYPTQISALDSSGTLASKAVLNYDGATNGNSQCTTATLTPTSGLPNHLALSGNRGNLTCVAAGIGPLVTTTSAYDDAGSKLKDIDGNGNPIPYGYMCSDAYLSTVSYAVTVHGLPLGTSTTYDCSSGLVTSTKDMNSQPTTYTYFTSGSDIGRLQNVTYPDTGSIAFSYPSSTETDESVRQTSTVTVTSKSIVDSLGRPYQTGHTVPEGEVTSETTYDATGRPLCVTNPHIQGTASATDGSTCTYYDALGRVTQTTMPDATSVSISYSGAAVAVKDELSHTKQYNYDAFQRLTSVMEPNSTGTLAYETDYVYNALDRLIEVDQWGAAKGSSSPGNRQRLFAYDTLGRRLAEDIPEEQSKLYPASLTCPGVTSANKWTGCYSIYDGNGNVKQTIDNAGNVVNYTYDALNRPLTKSQSTGAISYSYTYDGIDSYNHTNPLGNLTYATNNNAHAGFSLSYDAMGRLSNENVCAPTNCTYGQSGINVAAVYDLAGNMVSLTYPDGRVMTPQFDSGNRFIGNQYSKWNSTSIGTSYYSISSFAPPGQATSAAFGNGATFTSAFNSRQNVRSRQYANSSGTLWARQYMWDKNGANLLLSVDGVTGYGRQFTYDQLNRVLSVNDIAVNNPGATKATGTVTIGGTEQSTQGNCRRTCQTVWDSGAVSVIVNGSLAGTAGYREYSTSSTIATALAASINANGNAVVTATASGAIVTLTSINGGPDSNYTLSTSISNDYVDFPVASFTATPSGSTLTGGGGSPPSNALNEAYAYDPFGNLTQSGNFSFSQSFTTFNQMSAGYSYDANGEEQNDIFGHTLTYDADGRLSSVQSGAETYVYDPQGNRVEVHGSTVSDNIYFGDVPIAILTNGTYSDLIYANGTLIAEVAGTQSANPTYRATDFLGSLTGDAPSSGALSAATDYAPYGQLFVGSSGSDSFGFTGLQWDSTTALWHAGFRQYSAQQGRWMTPDPYNGSYNWADPQSLNRYAYVNGRPTSFADLSGLDGGPPPFGPNPVFYPLDELADLVVGWLNSSGFHGSLKPRPSANPWNDRFGIPYGGLTNGIQRALGLPTMGDISPIFDATTHSPEDTWNILHEAYCGATAGPIQGLKFIYHKSKSDYDFGGVDPKAHGGAESRTNDIYDFGNGLTMKADNFANFVAGFEGASWDNKYTLGLFGPAKTAVEGYGVYYHWSGQSKSSKYDKYDRTGMPDIWKGELFGNYLTSFYSIKCP